MRAQTCTAAYLGKFGRTGGTNTESSPFIHQRASQVYSSKKLKSVPASNNCSTLGGHREQADQPMGIIRSSPSHEKIVLCESRLSGQGGCIDSKLRFSKMIEVQLRMNQLHISTSCQYIDLNEMYVLLVDRKSVLMGSYVVEN